MKNKKLLLLIFIWLIEIFSQQNDIKISETGHSAFTPKIAATNNSVVITWSDYRYTGFPIGDDCGSGGDIFFQMLDLEGNLIGNNVRATEDSTEENCSYASQSFPEFDVNINGSMLIAWNDFRDNEPMNLMGQLYKKGGKYYHNFQIGDDLNYAKGAKQILLWDDNSFDVLWKQGTTFKLFGQGYDSLGIRRTTRNHYFGFAPERFYTEKDTGKTFILVADNFIYHVNSQNYEMEYIGELPQGIIQDIAINEQRELFVVYFVWDDPKNSELTVSDVYILKYDLKTRTMSELVRINEDIPNTQQETICVSTENDNVVTAWEDTRNGTWDVYIQRFTRYLDKVGGNIKITHEDNLSYQRAPSVLLKNSVIYLCWLDGRSLEYFPGVYPPDIKADIWATVQPFDNPFPGEIITPPIDSTLYVTELTVDIFPNPANGKQNIIMRNSQSSYFTLEVFDILGQLVYTETYPSHYRKVTSIINRENSLASGVYIIRISAMDTNGAVSSKSIKSIIY